MKSAKFCAVSLGFSRDAMETCRWVYTLVEPDALTEHWCNTGFQKRASSESIEYFSCIIFIDWGLHRQSEVARRSKSEDLNGCRI